MQKNNCTVWTQVHRGHKGVIQMEITKEQVIDFLKANDEVIKEVVSKTHIENYLATDEGKKLLQPKLDKHFNKGLETWKENNLSKLVDEKVQEMYPEETAEMRKIKELEAKLQQKENEAIQKELILKAQTLASENGLPTTLASYFVGANEEVTVQNIEKFNEVFKSALDHAIVERTKGTTPKMPTTAPQSKSVKDMTFTEFAKSLENK